ncbi:ABC transporter ATP-binding protein [candidate division KSB1 bacterium]
MNNAMYDEEALGKAYDGRLMKRLILYLKPYISQVLLTLILLILSSLGILAGPILSQRAIDNYIIPGDFQGLLLIVGLYLAILVFVFVFQYFHYFIMNMIGQKIMYDMRSQIFSHLQSRSLSYFDRNPIGRLVTRLTTDIDGLNEMFTSGVVTIFGDLVLLFGIVAVLFYFNVKLALISISVVPLLFGAALVFKIKVRGGFRQIRILIARINSFLQENITGMKIVQLFNREDKNFRQFERVNADHLQTHIRTVFYHAVFFPTVEILSALAIAMIIWFGGLDVISRELTFGALFMFVMYAQKFYRPIQDISEKYGILQSAMATSERIFRLLDSKEEIPDRPDAVTLSTVRGDIEFRNVWFAYKENDWVLKDISLRVKQGEKVAIVGATGAGKTTLISLLTRFYQVNQGEILVGGTNIENLTKESLRKHIGVVLQDVYLFSGNVRDNITLGNEKISEEQLVQAARDVNADQFIARLEHGYDEIVRERGSNFSTGQKQLMSFARALVYNPQILVLDEATSNIDTETEILIQKAVSRLMEKRTSIIIAHRLSTIKNVDRIIVMHKGKIREAGTHKDLLEKRGIYYKLYHLQYKDQEVLENVL